MNLTITARELFDRGIWDKFCDLTGTSPWCVNEGLADSDTEFHLTGEQARELGIIQ